MKNKKQYAPDMRKPGRRTQGGFSLVELLVVVAIILIITAIAIPKLLAARSAGQMSAAAATTRTFYTAQETYYARYNNGYGSAVQLMTPPATGNGACDTAGIFPAPSTGAGATWTAGNYNFAFVSGTANASPATGCTGAGFSTWTMTATPIDATLDGYFVDQTGTVRHDVGSATAASNPLGQ